MIEPIPKPVKKTRSKAPFDASYKGTKEPITCKTCSTQFISYQAVPSKYCSLACMKTSVIKQCKNCTKDFTFYPSQLNAYKGAGQYCSRPCSYAGQVEENKDAPTKDRYGRTERKADKDWQLAIRLKNDYTCQRCGKYERYIHTHHVATRRQRPDLKHEVSNGICLCGPCHSWVHHHPIESVAAGWLSNARYELEALKQRKINAGLAQRNGRAARCTNCGKETYYASATLSKLSKAYRCKECYQTVHYQRKEDGGLKSAN